MLRRNIWRHFSTIVEQWEKNHCQTRLWRQADFGRVARAIVIFGGWPLPSFLAWPLRPSRVPRAPCARWACAPNRIVSARDAAWDLPRGAPPRPPRRKAEKNFWRSPGSCYKLLKHNVVCNLSKLGGTMIVCSCNVLSDRDIRDSLGARGDRPSVGSVFRRMGCEPNCGRCARSIVAIVEQHVASGLDERGGNGDCDGCRADGLAA